MRIAAVFATAVLLALAACKGLASVQDANAKVAVFHQRLDAGDFDAIWADSGPDMQNTDKKAFVRLLSAVRDQLGKVRNSKQTGWNTQMDTGGSETEVTMQTEFERGSRKETFLFRSTGQGARLAGYTVE
jgi:hypothetical protein